MRTMVSIDIENETNYFYLFDYVGTILGQNPPKQYLPGHPPPPDKPPPPRQNPPDKTPNKTLRSKPPEQPPPPPKLPNKNHLSKPPTKTPLPNTPDQNPLPNPPPPVKNPRTKILPDKTIRTKHPANRKNIIISHYYS